MELCIYHNIYQNVYQNVYHNVYHNVYYKTLRGALLKLYKELH